MAFPLSVPQLLTDFEVRQTTETLMHIQQTVRLVYLFIYIGYGAAYHEI